MIQQKKVTRGNIRPNPPLRKLESDRDERILIPQVVDRLLPHSSRCYVMYCTKVCFVTSSPAQMYVHTVHNTYIQWTIIADYVWDSKVNANILLRTVLASS
jgi:hypothetical protein